MIVVVGIESDDFDEAGDRLIMDQMRICVEAFARQN